MPISTHDTANTCGSRNSERIEETTNEISHELIEEKIKANLEPLKEKIPTLTQLLDQLILESSARTSPTVDTRSQQTRTRRSPSHEAGTSRALPAREIGSRGSPPDTRCLQKTYVVKLQSKAPLLKIHRCKKMRFVV